MQIEFVKPMLLERAPDNKPIDSNDYICEVKLDGARMIATISEKEKRFYTRHGLDITSRFPELQQISVEKGCILDGELILTDEEGKPEFEALMQRFHSKRSYRKTVQFVAFDVIAMEDRKVTNYTLIERKFMLDHLIPKDNDFLVKMKYIVGNGEALYDVVKKEGLEGICQKKKHSKYMVGKRSSSGEWLKVINYEFANVIITGYKKKEFGWLLKFEDGGYAGVMELGVPNKAKMALYNLTDSLKTYEDDEVVYLEHLIRCRVKYRNLTKRGLLRLPSFVKFL